MDGMGIYIGKRLAADEDVRLRSATAIGKLRSASPPPPKSGREVETTRPRSNSTSPKLRSRTRAAPDSPMAVSWARLRANVESLVRPESSEPKWKTLFKKDIPDTEVLIEDFSCAWHRDILIQGRLYITGNFLCFYSYILGWETKLIVKLDQVLSLEREFTARVIPNAIKLVSKTANHTFTSFLFRDRSLRCLELVLAFSRGDSPYSLPDLVARRDTDWRVPESEIEGMIDTSLRSSSPRRKPLQRSRSTEQAKIFVGDKLHVGNKNDKSEASKNDQVESESIKQLDCQESHDSFVEASNVESVKAANATVGAFGPVSEVVKRSKSAVSPRVERRLAQRANTMSSVQLMESVSKSPTKNNGNPSHSPISTNTPSPKTSQSKLVESTSSINEGYQESGDLKSGDAVASPSSPFDMDGDTFDVHKAEYEFSIESLYRLLYGNPEPLLNHVAKARKMSEIDSSDWQKSDDSSRLQKRVTYRLALNYSIGPKSTIVYEVHEEIAKAAGQFYLIEAVVKTPGVPYGKSFSSTTRCMLTKISATRTKLEVKGSVSVSNSFLVPRSLITGTTKDGVISYWESVNKSLSALAHLGPNFVGAKSPPRPPSPDSSTMRELIESKKPSKLVSDAEPKEEAIHFNFFGFEIGNQKVLTVLIIIITLSWIQLFLAWSEVAILRTMLNRSDGSCNAAHPNFEIVDSDLTKQWQLIRECHNLLGQAIGGKTSN